MIRRASEAISAGDVEAALALADPELVFEPLRAEVQGAYLGHEGLRRFLADNAESFDFFRLTIEDVEDLGAGRYLVTGVLRFRGAGSGLETEVGSASIVTVRDGRIATYKDHGDRATALAARRAS